MAFTAGTPGAIQAVPATAGHFGQGVKYPLALTASGRLALSSGVTSVNDALASIVQTAPGERVMQPDYGAAVLTFDLVDPDRVMATVGRSISDHEARIAKASFAVNLGQQPSDLEVTITYVLTGEANVRTLTVPFYAGPTTTTAAGV